MGVRSGHEVLDSVLPLSGPAYFERGHGAWILSTWGDVAAALGDRRLVIAEGAVPLDAPEPIVTDPAQVGAWRTELERAARTVAGSLPAGRPIDLVGSCAAPWSLQLAARVAGISLPAAEALLPWSRAVFDAAAHATGPDTTPAQREASAALARQLPPAALSVQTFVALAHTLPHLLASAWHLLIQDPDLVGATRDDALRLPLVMEELLRLGGPSRVVFRIGTAPVAIGAARIQAGQRVQLHLATANRDPLRFAEPDRLLPERSPGGHLAFGRGRHACAGAQLVRHAAGVATAALLEATRRIEPAGDPTWLEGNAIRAPASLPVVLRR